MLHCTVTCLKCLPAKYSAASKSYKECAQVMYECNEETFGSRGPAME